MGADEVGRSSVIWATDAAGKPSHFYCHICRKDVSVLTHGPHEVLRHFQSVKHFARYQRLRLETPDWQVLDFEGNPLSESELKRRRESILQGPLVIRDREYPFAEDLIVDDSGAPDATLPVLAKLSSLVWSVAIGRVLRAGSPTVVAIYNNCQSSEHRRNMVSGRGVGWYFPFYVSTYPCPLAYWCCVLVDHFERDVPPHPFPRVWLSEGAWAIQHWIWGARIRNLGAVRTWGRSTFRRVCVALLSRVSANSTLEATFLAKILDAAGPDTSVVSLCGGPHVLAEVFASYLGSGYRAKLVEHPTFDLRLLKRCLQQTAASVFGSLDQLSWQSLW